MFNLKQLHKNHSQPAFAAVKRLPVCHNSVYFTVGLRFELIV